VQRKGTAVVVTTWRDASSSPGSMEVHALSVEIATVESRAATLAARLSAVSDCSLTGYNLNYTWFDNASSPASGFQIVQVKAVLVFRCDGVEQYAVLHIPGVKLSLLEDETPSIEIDITQPAIVDITDNLIAMGACNPMGYAIVELINAYIDFIP
jgi:hypothetical protein